jgi:hypothetical protein
MAARNSVVVEGHEYVRDSFSIHTEQRLNGWGFRIRSYKFYMIYCMGGFQEEDIALIHASEYVDWLKGAMTFPDMNVKDTDARGIALPVANGAPKGKRKVKV